VKEKAMLKSLFAQLRQRMALRASIGGLLARHDDHLLEDIGLTRHGAEMILLSPPQVDAPQSLQRSTAQFC
jgi:uncharacterized protein YjiS (DUF1127 family)